MTRARTWTVAAAGAVALLLLLVAGIAWRQLPDDEQLAAELSARFEKATGIGLRVGAAHWALRPVPVVVIDDLATAQPQPVRVRRIVLRPRLAPLWQRQLAIDSLEIEGVVLPRESVRAFRDRLQPGDAAGLLAGGPWRLAELPLETLRLRDITWVDRRGIALAYDADIRFDPQWRPREAELSRPGVSPPARLRLAREGTQDRWQVAIDVGGGTWNGSASLEAAAAGGLRLAAQLDARGVDIAGLVGAFGRNNAVAGRVEGRTDIDGTGEDVGQLLRSVRTRTRFTVRPATLKGFDLLRLVRSAESPRGGQTVFDELTGTLETEFREQGTLLRYRELRARSGLLTASGSASVLDRRLDGEAAIDVVDGVVGVPLKLAGTLDNPSVSLTGAALTGAAIGTAVLPGVGTAIGARIGQQVEKILGDEDKKKGAARPSTPRGR